MKFLPILFIFAIISAFSRETIILNPEDPKYFWMDELIEKEFSTFPKKLSKAQFDRAEYLHQTNGWYGNWLIRLKVLDNEVFGTDGAGKSYAQIPL